LRNYDSAKARIIPVRPGAVNYNFFSGLCVFRMSGESGQLSRVAGVGARMKEKLEIVCGHCDRIVALPTSRLSDHPRCPQCHFELFEGRPVPLTTSNFDRHRSRNGVPVVVDFWAPWCGPCKAMAPFFEASARQLEPRLRFAKLNTDDETAPAERYQIRSIPTLIVFDHGGEVARQSGAMGGAALRQWLETVLAQIATVSASTIA